VLIDSCSVSSTLTNILLLSTAIINTINTQLAAARAALSEKEAELDHVTTVTRHSEANKEQQRQRLESAHAALRDAEARAAAAGAAADAARRELEVRSVTVL
jgi:multidrug efflux pump subunit AcrA (membrane-fusion protein)